MQLMKEYLCDGRTPSDDEIIQCIEIANTEECVVKLNWYFPYNGWHHLLIAEGMTFEECKEKLPKRYAV